MKRKAARSVVALASLLMVARLATSQGPPQPAAAKPSGPECAGMPKLRAAKLPNSTTVLRSAIANAAQQAKGKAQPAPAHCEVVGAINERTGVNSQPYAI